MRMKTDGRIFGAAIAVGLLSAIPAAAQGLNPGQTIVDANGKFVGYLVSQNFIELHLHGAWVFLRDGIQRSGFANSDPTEFALYYTSSDCSGQAYLPSGSMPLQGFFVTNSNTLLATGTVIYPGPDMKVTIVAVKRGFTSLSPLTGGTCTSFTPIAPFPVGKYTTTDVTFAAPFRLR